MEKRIIMSCFFN